MSIRSFLSWAGGAIFYHIIILPYGGSVHHFTIHPSQEIALHQHDAERLKRLLSEFKIRKTEEAHFVKQAVRQDV
jgi:hypothetical protein